MPATANRPTPTGKTDDPDKIAAHLVREEGLDGAIDVATRGIQRAQDERDFYALSVWREVRHTLREWRARSD